MAHSWTGLVLALGLFTAGDLSAQIRTRASGDFWSSAGFIYTEGSGNDAGRIGASLGWRCSGRRLEVVYGWGRYFVGSGGTVVVTLSVDDGEARSSRWLSIDPEQSCRDDARASGHFVHSGGEGRKSSLQIRSNRSCERGLRHR